MKVFSTFIMMMSVGLFLVGCGPAKQQTAPPSAPSAEQTKPASQTPTSNDAAQVASSTNDCSFVMGFDIWEPYQFLDIRKQARGLDVDLLNLVAEDMQCTVEFKQDTWINLLNQLKTGDIDLVLGASMTDKRKEFAWFSDAYREERFQLYIRTSDVPKFRYADITGFMNSGKHLGIIGDYYYGEDMALLMENESLSPQFHSAIMSEINLARLLDEDIDGYLEDSFVGASLIRRRGLASLVAPHNINISNGPVYAMFSKKSVKQEDVERFNHSLNRIKENGQLDTLFRQYAY